jgi:hypothetical protein
MPVYRARRQNRPSAGAVSAAALQIFGDARAFALSGAPNVRRRLQRAASLRTRANIQRLKFSPALAPSIFPPAPPPQVDSAVGRAVAHRRAVDQPRPRLLPAPSPRAVAHRPETPPVLLPAFSTPPLPWRRAYCQHGAAKTLAGLLTRYAPPPAAIIFSQFFSY